MKIGGLSLIFSIVIVIGIVELRGGCFRLVVVIVRLYWVRFLKFRGLSNIR